MHTYDIYLDSKSIARDCLSGGFCRLLAIILHTFGVQVYTCFKDVSDTIQPYLGIWKHNVRLVTFLRFSTSEGLCSSLDPS